MHGLHPEDAIIRNQPTGRRKAHPGEDLSRPSTAIGIPSPWLLLGGINYYTGQFLTIPAITHPHTRQEPGRIRSGPCHRISLCDCMTGMSTSPFGVPTKYLNGRSGAVAAPMCMSGMPVIRIMAGWAAGGVMTKPPVSKWKKALSPNPMPADGI